MIPWSSIAHWRLHAPWLLDRQVEQDLVISRALVELFSDPVIAGNLAFRGGTALHKLHLAPAARYSEDIDLVQISPEPIGPVLDAIRTCLQPWLGRAKWKQKENMCTLVYRFMSEAEPESPEPSVPMRLKVEIYTREPISVLGIVDLPFEVDSPWFVGTTHLRTFKLEELLGTKLRALYQRRKGRDVFDLAHALERHPHLDRRAIVDCFSTYMARNGETPLRAEFEANLAEKRADLDFMSDMRMLLHPRHHPYEAHHALERIERELVALLPETRR